MEWAEELTAANDRITLFVAFNYGGRAEIVDAAERFTGGSEEEFRRHLYAPEMHDPDLLIRTSGERRISNYLLWQCAYSELVFRDELWPDFTREAFEESLGEYEERERRFGAQEPARVREGARPCLRRRDGRADEAPPSSAAQAGARRGAASRCRRREARPARILVAVPWIVFAIFIGCGGHRRSRSR